MTPAEFGKIIKNDIHGIFLFYGEELYLKQYYFNMVKNATSSDGTNIFTILGEGNTLPNICEEVAAIASIPSLDMSKRLIHIHDFEWKKIKEEHFTYFEDCADTLADYTDVVVIFDTRPDNFDAGTEKKPSKLFSKIAKITQTVHFAKETPARIAAWVQKHFAANKINASADICNTIVKYCGRDMSTLNNEILKLSAYVLQDNRNTVTVDDIHYITSFNNEIDTYDFSNAIMNGNSERAFSILSDMIIHKESPELIMGAIMNMYSELYTIKVLLENGDMLADIMKKMGMGEYPAKLRIQRVNSLSKAGLEKAISLCREADLKIKASALDNYEVIEVLLIKLFMTGKLR